MNMGGSLFKGYSRLGIFLLFSFAEEELVSDEEVDNLLDILKLLS